MNEHQIDYVVRILQEKKEHLNDQYQSILRSKALGMHHINGVLQLMELNNDTILQLNKMKREVSNGVFGCNN